MLKLPKGLKKKKKGKKSKKDQELFTEEELEQYRREHQNQSALNSAAPSDSEDQPAAASSAAAAAAGGSEKPESENEEWSKFAALTSGIDSVLKKTQGDLDRIKSTSFFQKVPTRVEQEAREREERERREQEEREREAEAAKAREEQRAAEELINAVVELSESEPNSEAEEDIFDTGYIDAIASGELPIAYVPESPVLESFEGEDPFDTSYAEKVIKGPEVSKRGKKLVSIGSAVEVLTGRVESVGTGSTKGSRQRRGIQNLLLASFDEGAGEQSKGEGEPSVGEQAVEEQPQAFSLLDDSADLPADVPIDLSVSLHLTLQKQQQQEKEHQEAGEAQQDATAGESGAAAPELDLDEFDDLKKRTPTLAGGDDFELLIGDAGSKTKGDLPVVDLDEFETAPSDDPFDTGFVERILPATAVEDDEFDPRAEEPTAPEDDFDFDPRAAERQQADLFPVQDQAPTSAPDLLSGSSGDLAGIAHAPLEAVGAGGRAGAATTASTDPFDTSDVELIVAPGKTELKFLEQELLAGGLSHSLSDPDFDPRGDSEDRQAEEGEQRSEEGFPSLAQRKSSLSLHIANGAANRSKSVVFAVPTPDLLKLDGEQSLAKKPLTPYYNREPSLPDAEADPFDTSFVPPVAPTQLELSLLEQELSNGAPLRQSLSDPEFDPRAASPAPAAEGPRSDLLGVSEEERDLQKVLTPARSAARAAVEADPFDTSIAVNLQPGRAELKLLEDELLPPVPKDSSAVSDILSDGAPEASSVFVKVLTPQASSGSLDLGGAGEQEQEIDPFDTSFVPSLGPGRAEIRLLESELIDQ
uniref:Protein stoned-A n=1 Tax=Anopheles epiroticus TaxID=199890 RepID=A0A182NZS2_9DIPT